MRGGRSSASHLEIHDGRTYFSYGFASALGVLPMPFTMLSLSDPSSDLLFLHWRSPLLIPFFPTHFFPHYCSQGGGHYGTRMRAHQGSLPWEQRSSHGGRLCFKLSKGVVTFLGWFRLVKDVLIKCEVKGAWGWKYLMIGSGNLFPRDKFEVIRRKFLYKHKVDRFRNVNRLMKM